MIYESSLVEEKSDLHKSQENIKIYRRLQEKNTKELRKTYA